MKENRKYANYKIGEYSYGYPIILTWGTENESLTVGKFCSFADNVTILLGGEHRSDWLTTYPFNALFKEFSSFRGHPKSKGSVEIGNDVWVGCNAIILSGVKIGDGAIVGAGSVVTKDVPAYAIVAGNPAKIIRMRFSDSVIEELLKIKWWDWSFERIRKNMHLMLSPNFEQLVKAEKNV